MMNIIPIEGPLGARIEGIDLGRPLSEGDFGKIRSAFLEYDGLLVFPDQDVSPQQHVEFGRRFGDLIVHPLFEFNHPDAQEVFILSNVVVNGKKKGIDDGGSYWHSDYSYKKIPALTTILHGLEIPSDGGNTLFLNMYKAYETLDDKTKAEIAELKGINQLVLGGGPAARDFPPPGVKPGKSETVAKLDPMFMAANQPVEHPVVRVHPETGRKAVYVHPASTHGIAGKTEEQGKDILYRLFAHITQPQFVYEHRWHKGDLVMWDNRCTMHAATTSALPATNLRTVHRVTVAAPCF